MSRTMPAAALPYTRQQLASATLALNMSALTDAIRELVWVDCTDLCVAYSRVMPAAQFEQAIARLCQARVIDREGQCLHYIGE